MSEIDVYERALTPCLPSFGNLLAGSGIAPERLMQTTLVSLERNPALMKCTPQSVINCAVSAAVIQLEIDGVTGQGFMVPYKVKGVPSAQFQIGYKGFPTIAARSGMTCHSGLIREGDRYEYEEGTSAYIKVWPKLGHENERKIEAVWAAFTRPGWDPLLRVLSIDQVLAVKGKSRGASRSDSPWNDPTVGFPAMAEKTAVRRAARLVPIVGMQRAVALEDRVHDMGKATYYREDGGLITQGEDEPIYADAAKPPPQIAGQPTIDLDPVEYKMTMNDGTIKAFGSVAEWQNAMEWMIMHCTTSSAFTKLAANNEAVIDQISQTDPEPAKIIRSAMQARAENFGIKLK